MTCPHCQLETTAPVLCSRCRKAPGTIAHWNGGRERYCEPCAMDQRHFEETVQRERAHDAKVIRAEARPRDGKTDEREAGREVAASRRGRA